MSEQAQEQNTSNQNRVWGIPPIFKEIIDWVLVVGIALVVSLLIRSFVFTMVLVDGPSMQQTLLAGDRLGVVRLAYQPKQGDIIVFYPNGQKERPYIKRVIALGGQTVDIRDEKVFVDGEELEEPYLGSPTTDSGNRTYPLVVPEGHVFAMGDNREHSFDCRSTEVGFVPHRDIVGKAVFRLMPFRRMGGLYGDIRS